MDLRGGDLDRGIISINIQRPGIRGGGGGSKWVIFLYDLMFRARFLHKIDPGVAKSITSLLMCYFFSVSVTPRLTLVDFRGS